MDLALPLKSASSLPIYLIYGKRERGEERDPTCSGLIVGIREALQLGSQASMNKEKPLLLFFFVSLAIT